MHQVYAHSPLIRVQAGSRIPCEAIQDFMTDSRSKTSGRNHSNQYSAEQYASDACTINAHTWGNYDLQAHVKSNITRQLFVTNLFNNKNIGY